MWNYSFHLILLHEDPAHIPGSFCYSEKGETVKVIKALIKKPDQDPVEKIFRPNLMNFDKIIGGPMYTLKIQLTSGKKIVIIYPQEQPNKKYNFTICPVEDKKSYIDINGNVIICGRRDDDQLTGVQLTEDELKELFRNPYEL